MYSDSVRISVLIATYARAPLLARTLDSLARVASAETLRHVWILENGSDGEAADVCRSFSDRLPIRYRCNAKSGKSRALQAALPEVADDLLLFLDDDVRVGTDVLDAYRAAASLHGPGHYFGGSLAIDYEEAPPAWLLPYLPRSAVGFTPVPTGDIATCWEFLGANFAAFATDVRKVGGFDPNVGPGAIVAGTDGNPLGAETVLHKRLFAAGCIPVAVPEAIVWHWVPRERCSPAWALHRAQRNAMTRMLQECGQEWHTLGIPRWLVRALLEDLPGYTSSWITTSAEQRFTRRLRLHETVGRIRAFRHLHEQQRSRAPSSLPTATRYSRGRVEASRRP